MKVKPSEDSQKRNRSDDSISDQKALHFHASFLLSPGNRLETICWTAKKFSIECVTKTSISKDVLVSVARYFMTKIKDSEKNKHFKWDPPFSRPVSNSVTFYKRIRSPFFVLCFGHWYFCICIWQIKHRVCLCKVFLSGTGLSLTLPQLRSEKTPASFRLEGAPESWSLTGCCFWKTLSSSVPKVLDVLSLKIWCWV